MPKIAQDTIDRIRDQADIVDIISQDVELKRRGINYFGSCPFHDEKTPSFSVNQDFDSKTTESKMGFFAELITFSKKG